MHRLQLGNNSSKHKCIWSQKKPWKAAKGYRDATKRLGNMQLSSQLTSSTWINQQGYTSGSIINAVVLTSRRKQSWNLTRWWLKLRFSIYGRLNKCSTVQRHIKTNPMHHFLKSRSITKFLRVAAFETRSTKRQLQQWNTAFFGIP
jgi:hypothetical protein